MVEVDIGAALRYPLRGDDALVRNAVGGGVPVVLSLATMALYVALLFVDRVALLGAGIAAVLLAQLLVGLVWTGYFVRVARQTAAGRADPPALDGWGALVADGLRGSLVTLAYVVPYVLLMVGIYGVAFASVLGMGVVDGGDASLAVGVVGILAWVVGAFLLLGYALVAGYLWPASLTVYAVEGSFRGSLSPATLRELAVSWEYAVPWMVVAGIAFWAYLIVSFTMILLVGYLLMPFLSLLFFYLGTAGFHGFGQAYVREVHADGGEPTPVRQEDL